MIEDVFTKIRRRQSRLYDLLYRAAKTGRRLRLPAPQLLYSFLYYIRNGVLSLVSSFYRLLWADPLFRSRCKKVGTGFYLIGGIPFLYGNLAIEIGDHVTLYGKSTFQANHVNDSPLLSIGNHTKLGYEVTISVGSRVAIGRYCYISDRVLIADHDGHPLDPDARRRGEPVSPDRIRPVTIEDDVWIGSRSVILKGVTIGRGAVVGAGSVVRSDVPARAIVSGNPARVVKRL